MHVKLIVLAVCIMATVSCANSGTKTESDSTAAGSDTTLNVAPNPNSQLEVKPISGYFLKNTITVNDSLTFWLIDNQASFDSLFGMAKTMNNTIDKPDFGTQIVVAATMPPTFYGTQIQLESATSDNANNNATLHFVATSNPSRGSASTVPLWLGAVPKTGKSTFQLYTGDHLTKTITTQQ
ncbi:hypothetical protein SAMN05660461_4058 [Chitinophaga ginsengisegetis]|uniref:Uncharacterized protein n=1 Tax=Chitinophaga ginsengisegetis TaxID=393003 RepID=A0A1T5P645_9BACT|nr:hypothetical protein [Chitinophaga ginsengisegetis]SKD08107.1 hypothetical protein SAMN05660461_4058 [Chitinophaga ginsengisegetis]